MADSAGKQVMLLGRIVWTSGDLFKGQPQTIFGTKQPKLDQQGNQVIQYGFGLAVEKAMCQEAWAAMHEEAWAIYPSRQVPPGFAWKYKDGDKGIDHTGAPYSQREGYPGCLVFTVTTNLPIRYFRNDGGKVTQVIDGIKCGDYVQAQVTIKGHPAIGQGKPGLYINPNGVLFVGYGKEIVSAPTGESIFGTTAPPLPPGATAAPAAPAGGFPGLGTPSFPSAGVTSAMPSYAPPQAPQPHHAVLPPQYQPQAPQAMPQAYPQPGVAPGHSQPPGYGQMPPPPGMHQSAAPHAAVPQMTGLPGLPQ